MLDESSRHANGTKQVGIDDADSLIIINGCAHVIRKHDACIVEQNIQFGIFRNQVAAHARDASRVLNIQFHGIDAGVLFHYRLQVALAPPRDDDLIAAFVKRLSHGATDAGPAACYKNGVA